MTTKLVIIGLPGAGKTTVFNALTHAEAQTGSFGGAADEPNLATVKVPDPRLDLLTEMFKPQRKVPADVQYLDVAGIAKGIAEKGMSGQLLGHLAQADALVHVVRAFEDDEPAAPRRQRRSAPRHRDAQPRVHLQRPRASSRSASSAWPRRSRSCAAPSAKPTSASRS